MIIWTITTQRGKNTQHLIIQLKIYPIENESLFSLETRASSFWAILYIGSLELCTRSDWSLCSAMSPRPALCMSLRRCRVPVRLEFWLGWVPASFWTGWDFLDSVWIFSPRASIRRLVYSILSLSRSSFLPVVSIIRVLNHSTTKDCLLMSRESILPVLLTQHTSSYL